MRVWLDSIARMYRTPGPPFRAAGGPGKFRADASACDRPYGDSPPSNIASYPFQPDKHDVRKIRKQLGLP